jgi:hypothetical protein
VRIASVLREITPQFHSSGHFAVAAENGRAAVAFDAAPSYARLMSFGRNPHVAKAEAAEQKADVATDDRQRERAWREAAHLWDRAADRETEARRRTDYAARAEAARAKADSPPDAGADRATRVADLASKLRDPSSWN